MRTQEHGRLVFITPRTSNSLLTQQLFSAPKHKVGLRLRALGTKCNGLEELFQLQTALKHRSAAFISEAAMCVIVLCREE